MHNKIIYNYIVNKEFNNKYLNTNQSYFHQVQSDDESLRHQREVSGHQQSTMKMAVW